MKPLNPFACFQKRHFSAHDFPFNALSFKALGIASYPAVVFTDVLVREDSVTFPLSPLPDVVGLVVTCPGDYTEDELLYFLVHEE